MNLRDLIDENAPWRYESVKVAEFRSVSEESRTAFNKVILPQAGEILTIDQLQQFVTDVVEAIETAVKEKDTLYTRLTDCKGIDQTDQAFFEDILLVVGQWARKVKEKLTIVKPEVDEPLEKLQSSGILELKEALIQSVKPENNLTPWDLTAALNTVFKEHGLRFVRAIPRNKNEVAISFDSGLVDDLYVSYRPGRGWFDLSGLASPERVVQEVIMRIVDAA
jgi:hypothetical protein